jgi:hypothetical protein
MAVHKRMAGIVILAALGLAMAGCGKKDATQGTPQETFDAFKNAGAKEDYKAFTDLLTTDSRNAMTGGALLWVGVTREQFEKLGLKGPMKPLQDVLKKHGVKEEAFMEAMESYKKMGEGNLKAVEKGSLDMGKAQAAERAFVIKLAELIKDQAAFVKDVRAVVVKLDPELAVKQDILQAVKNSELKDVTTTGDTAKGTIVTKHAGVEKRVPIQFRKEDGAWRVDLTEVLFKKGGQ